MKMTAFFNVHFTEADIFIRFFSLYLLKQIRRYKVISKEVQINEAIRDKEVRLIDSDGTMLGIMSSRDAQKIADEKKLDLVKISPNANPPVCKILDYGKYRYEMQKREKEAKKKQKTMEVKEVRLSPYIESHDLNVKAKNASKFLTAGDKVKVSIRFRGRERDFTQIGFDVMNSLLEVLGDICTVEKKPTMEGRHMIMILAPKNN